MVEEAANRACVLAASLGQVFEAGHLLFVPALSSLVRALDRGHAPVVQHTLFAQECTRFLEMALQDLIESMLVSRECPIEPSAEEERH